MNKIIAAVADTIRQYGLQCAITDQWSGDSLVAIARHHSLDLRVHNVTAQNRYELYDNLRSFVATGRIELPPDPVVRADLLAVKKRVVQQNPRIELVKTPDGRHADTASAIAMAVTVAWRHAAAGVALQRKMEGLVRTLDYLGFAGERAQERAAWELRQRSGDNRTLGQILQEVNRKQ